MIVNLFLYYFLFIRIYSCIFAALIIPDSEVIFLETLHDFFLSFFKLFLFINANCDMKKIMVMANIPNTLKFTHMFSGRVRQIISLIIAMPRNSNANLLDNIIQFCSVSLMAELKRCLV